MKFSSADVLRAAEDFKGILLQLQDHHKITDTRLAARFGLSSQTISRWKDPSDECNFPAFGLRLFLAPDLNPLALGLLRYLLEPYRCDCVEIVGPGKLNGSINDEILESVTELGALASHRSIRPDTALHLLSHADRLIRHGYTMKAEIRARMDA